MKIVCLLFFFLAHMVKICGAAEIFDYDRMFGWSDKIEERKYMCADVVFAIDLSCSVKIRDKKKMVTIVEKIVNASRVKQTISRFGLVLFDEGARKIIGLSQNINNAKVMELLKNLKINIKDQKEGCKTHTWKALEQVRTDEDLLGSVSRYDNKTGKERKRVLILMTDGKPRDTKDNVEEMENKTREMGTLNKSANITTFVVHVPKDGRLEPIPLLEDLVSSQRWIYEVHNSTNLEDVGDFFFYELVKIGACDYRCMGKIDLCIVMDRSDSIEIEDIELTKEFLKDLADSFRIVYDKSNKRFTSAMIGVSSYNQDVYQHSLGTKCKDNACVRAAIDTIPDEHNTYTETDVALANVASECLPTYVTRGDEISRVAILATDGNTYKFMAQNINSRPTIQMAKRLRSKGIDIVVIGLPNYRDVVGIDEWNKTASHFVFDMRNGTGPGWSVKFEDLKSITGTVARKICEQYTEEQTNEV
ncbi:unnamed protein product [Owenia fusiformis]|uniref:VWFA domain-containing protein n=1 Tax=Owenia fusiformis TaxID=6347 RepID=A0A8S4PF15_OWEFU|nr:unnamed protein product [Owenia fusiformis]